MKGCIAIQGNYAKIGHALALYLRDTYQVQEFCAYVLSFRAEKFIKDQTDIAYTKFLIDHEVHEQFHSEVVDLAYIREMEKKYAETTFWTSIYTDRLITMNLESMDQQTMKLDPLYGYNDILKILQVRVRKTVEFLQTEKPDFIMFFAMGVIGNMLLYTIAKRMGIRVLVIDLARLGSKMAISEDYHTITGVKELFERIRNGQHISPQRDEAMRLVTEIKKNKTVNLGYTVDALKPEPVTMRRRFAVYINILRCYLTERGISTYERPSTVWHVIKFRLLERWRKYRGYADLYTAPDLSQSFAFFPLQCEPELSLLNIAPFYTDQLMVIRAVARSLPVGMILYVKEHPAMLYRRTRSYYKELLMIPNVRLVDATIKSTTLIDRAALVTTITGTAGWEAMLLGKPVITFGHVFFNDFPSVTRCGVLDELPTLVEKKLTEAPPSNDLLADYVAALLENGVVDFPYFLLERVPASEVVHHPGLHAFADLVAQKVGLRPVSAGQPKSLDL